MESVMLNLLIVFCVTVTMFSVEIQGLSQGEIAKQINAMNTTWKAHKYFNDNYDFKRLSGTIISGISDLPLNKHAVIGSFPPSFDSRSKWPKCPSIKEIRNQGPCGSCWAFASSEAMTDRVCIHSDAKVQFHVSSEDLLSCCNQCWGSTQGGCFGGSMDMPWIYWVKSGIVSGGNYGSNKGCRPYTVNVCVKDDSRLACQVGTIVDSPTCQEQCTKNYKKSYNNDKNYGMSAYQLLHGDETQIMQEIFLNGPVSASFFVYEDFHVYKNGVYQHKIGDLVSGHAIKIIGWGVENGTPYWLCANSWGENWSDLKGFFKILRGKNQCGIETNIVAGLPKL